MFFTKVFNYIISCARFGLVLLSITSFIACSFAIKKPPKASQTEFSGRSVRRCTSSKILPIIDASWAGLQSLAVLAVISDPEGASQRLGGNILVPTLISLAWIAGSGSAAIYGFRNTERCKELQESFYTNSPRIIQEENRKNTEQTEVPLKIPKGLDKMQQAKKVFEEARINYNLQKYDLARQGFEESYALSKEPDLLINVGQCYRQMKQYEKAIKMYKTYLFVNPDSPIRESVEATILEIEKLNNSENN